MDGAAGPTRARFEYSPGSYAARMRMWTHALIALVVVGGTALGLLAPAEDRGILILVGSLVLLGLLLLAAIAHRRLRPGRALVVLDEEGIESFMFPGVSRRIVWPDIIGARFRGAGHGRLLELRLRERPGRLDRRRLLFGSNPARPTMELIALDAEAQMRLLDLILEHVTVQAPGAAPAVGALATVLHDENAFLERLRTLAPRPYLTWLLIGANLVTWLASLALGAEVLRVEAGLLLEWGGNAASEVQKGEWWRLLASAFLHGNLFHLVMNMVGLAAAGPTVERIYGQRQFFLIYLGAALVGSALSLHHSAQAAVSVGASGAVFGVLGALFVALLQHRDKVPKSLSKQTLGVLAFFILYSLKQGFDTAGVDNAAHVGGLIGGCALAFLLAERFDLQDFTRKVTRRLAIGIAAVLVGTAGIALTAPPAEIDQMARVRTERAMADFMVAYNRFGNALQADVSATERGIMSAREADERSRSVHAPMARALFEVSRSIQFADNDPRADFVRELRMQIRLSIEMLEMESHYPDGSDTPQPVDPALMARLEQRMADTNRRIAEWGDKHARRK